MESKNNTLILPPPTSSSSSCADVDHSSDDDNSEASVDSPQVHFEDEETDLLLPLLAELHSVVPRSTPYIRAETESLIANAIAYIRDLELMVQRLEMAEEEYGQEDERKIEVEVIGIHGTEAVIRARSADVDHAPARLFGALRDLDAEVRRASITGMEDVVQGVTARVPAALADTDALTAALLAAVNG